MQYTPKLYERLATPLSLDLGTTVGALADIRVAVQTGLPTQLQPVADNVSAIKGTVAGLAGALNTVKGELLTKIDATATSIVSQLQQSRPPVPQPTSDAFFDSVSLLIQAQAFAFDATPDEVYAGTDKRYGDKLKDNVGLDALRGPAQQAAAAWPTGSPLRARFTDSFRDFTSGDRAYRSQRYWEMHQLIEDIAAN
jgi:hypothetical protein